MLQSTITVLAFALSAASTLSSKKDRVVEVGANAEHKPLIRSGATHQWFGGHLGAAEGSGKAHQRQQIDGFNLEEIRARHEGQKSHHFALEEESQVEHHKIHADAGIPILQAAKSKPGIRDMWPRDIEDPEPGDGFAPPRDVENSPGDALIEVAEKKSSLMRREPEASLTAREAKRASDCEKCQDCSTAVPNQPDNNNHTDGVWCMCNSWADWQTMSKTPGVYPGPNPSCTKGCKAETNATKLAGINCASLNCSCDLNIYWEGDKLSAGSGAAASSSSGADGSAAGAGSAAAAPAAGDGS